MSLTKAFYFFILTCVLAFVPVAVVHASGDRDLVVQKQMDCVDGHLHLNNAIGWNDVCEIPDSTSSQQIQKANEQLDQVEGIAPIQTVTERNVGTIARKKSPWTFDIAPEISGIKYHEVIDITDKGTMAGINASTTYHPEEGQLLNSEISNMYRLEGRLSYGKVNYKGFLSDGLGDIIPYSYKGINDTMLEIRGLIGKDFTSNRNTLTPYVGLGYRYLNDDASVLEGGYNRHIYYLYIPAGFELEHQLNDQWAIGGNLEYDFFVWGEADSYATIGNIPIQNTQKDGFGIRGSFKIIKKYNYFNVYLEPYFRYWHIYNSQKETVLFGSTPEEVIEPENTSLEVGGKLGIEF